MSAKTSISTLLFLAATVIFSGCNIEDDPIAKVFTFDFSASQDGWSGGFADHPDTTTADYKLVFKRTTLPSPLNTSKKALKIGGTNRSDDLFMFIKRKITGLEPNKTYKIKFDVEFASNVPTGHVGVGGSPDAVYMKAGASQIEPISEFVLTPYDPFGYYRMNIDKGNQATDGSDMYNIGKIGVADTTTVYTLISRNNNNRPFPITTNANGEVWVIIGTDSGFESRTELYYNKIVITFISESTPKVTLKLSCRAKAL